MMIWTVNIVYTKLWLLGKASRRTHLDCVVSESPGRRWPMHEG
jgi:hypothetical protein